MKRRFLTNDERIARAITGDPRARAELEVRHLAWEAGELVGDLKPLDAIALDALRRRLLGEVFGL